MDVSEWDEEEEEEEAEAEAEDGGSVNKSNSNTFMTRLNAERSAEVVATLVDPETDESEGIWKARTCTAEQQTNPISHRRRVCCGMQICEYLPCARPNLESECRGGEAKGTDPHTHSTTAPAHRPTQ